MHWLLIGYMFLFIHRPFEVWPWLGELHVERAYVLLMLAVWLIAPGKRWLPNWQHAAFAAFAGAVLVAWLCSPWADHGQPIVEDYLKILVFYLLLVTNVHDERGLKRMIYGFMMVMTLYLLHSFREYLNGRHTYRMGIERMIGVDATLGDPNSFAASIVFALPLALALWRSGFYRVPLLAYLGLSVLCLLLTGSRSGLLGLSAWLMLLTFSVRRGWLVLLGILAIAPAAFVGLPESLQKRFETIVNPDIGSDIERQSGQGRIQGFFTGLELWTAYPITGVGPGAWRPATGSNIESHNLYGQLVGELGTLGLVAFLILLMTFVFNLRALRARPGTTFDREIARAIGTAVILLLVMGCFGHNLFRFTWVWYGGFLIIARHIAATAHESLVDLDTASTSEWTWHSNHVPAFVR